MPFMVFTEKMIDGVDAIDRQHAKLVDIINELYDLVLRRDDNANLERVFDELTAYTVYHFDYEEKLFAATGYPKAAEHHAQHEALKQKVVAYRAAICDPRDTAFAAEVLHFLKQWLTYHTLGSDRDACHHLNAHGIR